MNLFKHFTDYQLPSHYKPNEEVYYYDPINFSTLENITKHTTNFSSNPLMCGEFHHGGDKLDIKKFFYDQDDSAISTWISHQKPLVFEILDTKGTVS
jgi:hypothetical protein